MMADDGGRCHPDKFDAVRRSLFENKTQKSGIPRHFRTAVLLNRNDSGTSRFCAKVDCRIGVSPLEDLKELARSVVGRRNTTPDDPLEFDPALKPKTRSFREKIDSLGADSVALEDLIFFKMYRNDGKGEAQDKNGTKA